MNLDASISVTTIIYSQFCIDRTKDLYTIILSGGMKIFVMNKEMQELFKLKLLCDLMTNDFMYDGFNVYGIENKSVEVKND